MRISPCRSPPVRSSETRRSRRSPSLSRTDAFLRRVPTRLGASPQTPPTQIPAAPSPRTPPLSLKGHSQFPRAPGCLHTVRSRASRVPLFLRTQATRGTPKSPARRLLTPVTALSGTPAAPVSSSATGHTPAPDRSSWASQGTSRPDPLGSGATLPSQRKLCRQEPGHSPTNPVRANSPPPPPWLWPWPWPRPGPRSRPPSSGRRLPSAKLEFPPRDDLQTSGPRCRTHLPLPPTNSNASASTSAASSLQAPPPPP